MVGAKVVIANEANGKQRDTETGSNGEYIFLEVPVGTYTIEVNQTGFKKYLRKSVIVDLNQIVGIDISLQVGGSSETVEVTGAPPLVDTTSTQLGAVVGAPTAVAGAEPEVLTERKPREAAAPEGEKAGDKKK